MESTTQFSPQAGVPDSRDRGMDPSRSIGENATGAKESKQNYCSSWPTANATFAWGLYISRVYLNQPAFLLLHLSVTHSWCPEI